MSWPEWEPAPPSMFHGMMNALNRASKQFRSASKAMEEFKSAMETTGFKGCLECGAGLEMDGIQHSVGCSGLQLTPGLMAMPRPGSDTSMVVEMGPGNVYAPAVKAQIPVTAPSTPVLPIRPAASFALDQREPVKVSAEALMNAPPWIVWVVQQLGNHGEVEQRGLERAFYVYCDRLYPVERDRFLAWAGVEQPKPSVPALPPPDPGHIQRVGERVVELEDEGGEA